MIISFIYIYIYIFEFIILCAILILLKKMKILISAGQKKKTLFVNDGTVRRPSTQFILDI